MKQNQYTTRVDVLSYVGRDFYKGSSLLTCTKVLILESGRVLIGTENFAYNLSECDFVVAVITK
jgi:hypothetical protein